jgi:uncharacterized membrane protein
VWEDGKLTDLPTLGGHGSTAVAIDDDGHILGTAAIRAHGQHAVVWTRVTAG